MPRKKFPGGKICNVSTSTTRNTQAHVNKTHSDIDIELANLFDAEFGRIFDPGKVLDASIAEKKNNQREHRAKLKAIKRLKAKDRPTPYSKIKQGLEQKLERATIDLENLQKQKRDIKKRQKIAQNIVDLLSERMHKAAFDSKYTLNVQSIMGVIKSFLVERTGTPFVSLNDLGLQTLNMKYVTLKKWFSEQDRGIVPKQFRLREIFQKDAVRGAYEWNLAHPAKVILYRDKSLAGIELESKVLSILSEKSAAKVKYKDKYNTALQKLQTFIETKRIVYFPDPNNQPENPDKLTEQESFENEANIMELVSDLMDGRTKYIEPQPSKDLIVKREIMGKYNEIITYANRGGWNISKDIHSVEEAGETYYYVTMKETDPVTGKETYKAYLAPHYINDKNQTVFYYPLTKEGRERYLKTGIIDKKSRNGAWVRAINQSQNAGKDLTDVMVPGFRQAQNEKIFNGYTKFNDEINVKGYDNYTLMDLNINDTMFETDIMRKGSKTRYNTSIWSHVKETRALLAEIFEVFQEGTKVSLKRIEEAAAKFPMIADALRAKGVNEEGISDTINELKQILNFNELIYLDDDGNVKSANITAGIKENYHPNLYVKWDYIANLNRAINAMNDEKVIYEDKITQLKHKLSQAVEDEDIRTLKGRIISTNNKLISLIGVEGDPSKPGLIAIFQNEKDMLLEKSLPSDMPNLSGQTMIKYAKHRRLFIDKLQSNNPNVKYGGRRKDSKVILEYIENLFETMYNNELQSYLPEAASLMDKEILDYMLEEVKAAVGRIDLAAGIPFFDLSNKKLLKGLNRIMPNLTEQRLHRIGVNNNSMVSAALLGSVGVGLGNRMQSPMSSIIEIGLETESKVINIYNNEPELMMEIAKATGALDTVQAVADIFLGGLESQADFNDGLHTKTDILLLQGQSLLRFVKGAKGIRRQMISLIKRREGSDATYTVDQIDAILAGVWEMVHGIAEGTMTEDEMKRLSVILKRVATANQIKVFVTWGLNVFGIKKSVADVAGLTQYFGMIEGEYEMRKIVALRGAIYYADVVVGGDMTGDYLHPDAIHFARQLINNTMFQFSLQHFAKVFRGTLGACIMKFKNYWVSQSNRELQIFGNFARSLKGRGKREILSEMSKLLFPSKNMPIPIPLIHKLFGFDPEKVGGFNFKEKGPFPFIKLTTSIGTESPTESFRQLIWTRGLITLFTVGTAHFWIVKRMYQYLGKKSPVNLFSLGRGGESTTGTLGLRFIQALLGGMAIGMSEEDEDENFTQLWRIFLPMYINALADLIKSGDPLKFTRLYGQWGNDFLEYVMGSDAE